MKETKGSFLTLDLGSGKPICVEMEVIEVELSSANLLTDYAKAFVKEAFRVNPLRAEQVKLSEDEMEAYCTFLLSQRVKSVNDNCPDFRKLKVLYIPSYIQHAMSLIGRVVIRKQGLTFVPVMDCDTITFEEALKISEKVGAFEDDLQIVQDAMPRDSEGNIDVMSTAMIAGYVRSVNFHEVSHPSFTYVTAFLGLKLRQEVAMNTLYRLQYDDVEFIRQALLTERKLY